MIPRILLVSLSLSLTIASTWSQSQVPRSPKEKLVLTPQGDKRFVPDRPLNQGVPRQYPINVPPHAMTAADAAKWGALFSGQPNEQPVIESRVKAQLDIADQVLKMILDEKSFQSLVQSEINQDAQMQLRSRLQIIRGYIDGLKRASR